MTRGPITTIGVTCTRYTRMSKLRDLCYEQWTKLMENVQYSAHNQYHAGIVGKIVLDTDIHTINGRYTLVAVPVEEIKREEN